MPAARFQTRENRPANEALLPAPRPRSSDKRGYCLVLWPVRGPTYWRTLQGKQGFQQDRSRQCKYIQSFDFFKIRSCVFLIDFTKNFSSNRLNIIKFVIYGSELVEIDTLLTRFRKFQFSRQKNRLFLTLDFALVHLLPSVYISFNSDP